MFRYFRKIIGTKARIKWIVLICVCILGNLVGLYQPILSGKFVDELIQNKRQNFLVLYCTYFLLLEVFTILFSFIGERMALVLQLDMENRMKSRACYVIQMADVIRTREIKASYYANRIASDSASIALYFISVVQGILVNGGVFIWSLYYIYRKSILMGFSLLGSAIVLIFLSKLGGKAIEKSSLCCKEEYDRFYSSLTEQIRLSGFAQLHSVIPLFQKRMWTAVSKVVASAKSNQLVHFRAKFLEQALINIVSIGFIFAIGSKVMNNELSVGEYTSLMSYCALIFSSVGKIYSLYVLRKSTSASYHRMMEIEGLYEDRKKEQYYDRIDSITLNNLSFSYTSTPLFSITNFTFVLGKTYGICGENGVGKTALLMVIAGMYNSYYVGEINYNDKNIDEIDVLNYRSREIAFCEQTPVFIHDSIENNIYLDNKNVTTKQRLQELLSMDLFAFLKKMDLSTMINDEEARLSNGEKQKIGILRTLLKDRPILLFDEPTSSLDQESKEYFYSLIDSIKRDKIIFIVSHDSDFGNRVDVMLSLQKSETITTF